MHKRDGIDTSRRFRAFPDSIDPRFRSGHRFGDDFSGRVESVPEHRTTAPEPINPVTTVHRTRRNHHSPVVLVSIRRQGFPAAPTAETAESNMPAKCPGPLFLELHGVSAVHAYFFNCDSSSPGSRRDAAPGIHPPTQRVELIRVSTDHQMPHPPSRQQAGVLSAANLARRTTRCTPVSQIRAESPSAVRREHQFIARPLSSTPDQCRSKICAASPAAVCIHCQKPAGWGAEENQMDEGAEHSRRTCARVDRRHVGGRLRTGARAWPRTRTRDPDRVPRLDGRLLFTPRTRAVRGGLRHLVHRTPLAVLEPGSVADIAR